MAKQTPEVPPEVIIDPDFSFPGMELFSPDQAKALSESIQETMGMQPHAVTKICLEKTAEWKDGRPDATQISAVEQTVKTRGCGLIAIETAKMLGGELTKEQVLYILTEARLVYKDIPQGVYAVLRPMSL